MGEGVVMHDAPGPGELGDDRRGPGRGDRRPHDPDGRGGASGPAGDRLAHATCSIFQSAWIALRPSNSHSQPYAGSLSRYVEAFDTHAGDPGTVEKTESRNVVTAPFAPRYGS